MGEAKRRKQVLGEDYGKVPSTLIEGTPQWEKHITKFYNAWNDKWDELVEIVQEFEDDEESLNLSEPDRIKEELVSWLSDYLNDYSVKDREQLVSVILDEHYDELIELSEAMSENSEQVSEITEIAMDWAIVALNYFSVLSPYLSPEVATYYAAPLNSFYTMTMEDNRQSGTDEEDLDLLTVTFSESLGDYFQPTPTSPVETVFDAPLELDYNSRRREVT